MEQNLEAEAKRDIRTSAYIQSTLKHRLSGVMHVLKNALRAKKKAYHFHI